MFPGYFVWRPLRVFGSKKQPAGLHGDGIRHVPRVFCMEATTGFWFEKTTRGSQAGAPRMYDLCDIIVHVSPSSVGCALHQVYIPGMPHPTDLS